MECAALHGVVRNLVAAEVTANAKPSVGVKVSFLEVGLIPVPAPLPVSAESIVPKVILNCADVVLKRALDWLLLWITRSTFVNAILVEPVLQRLSVWT